MTQQRRFTKEFAEEADDPEVAEKYRQMAARFEAIARSVGLARAFREPVKP